jgi:hypothetical protein
MWAYEHNFHIEDANERQVTLDCGVEVELDHSSCAIHRDYNMIEWKLDYVRKIQEIMQVDFSSFQCVIFKCKWWNTLDQSNVKEDHVSRRMWDEVKDPYVFPKHCNQVFFTLMCWIGIGGSY